MNDYELQIAFTEEQLKNLHVTGSSVVIAKPSLSGVPDVTWQVFKPFQNNTISWNNEYGIYASTSSVVHGSNLNQFSSVPVGAVKDKLYILEPSAVIVGPTTGGKPDSYALKNQYEEKPYLTIGLCQNAIVNGSNVEGHALSAKAVLLASTAFITPYTTVYIWLQSQIKSNSVITGVSSPMTELKFDAETKQLSVVYDSLSGKFIPADVDEGVETFIDYISVSDANRLYKAEESWRKRK